jgi:hypothetical protein
LCPPGEQRRLKPAHPLIFDGSHDRKLSAFVRTPDKRRAPSLKIAQGERPIPDATDTTSAFVQLGFRKIDKDSSAPRSASPVQRPILPYKLPMGFCVLLTTRISASHSAQPDAKLWCHYARERTVTNPDPKPLPSER